MDLRQSSRARGLVAAVLAYAAWGFLAPGAKILLANLDPWAINFHRTWLSIVVFSLAFGPARSLRAVGLLGKDWRLWLLGVGGMGVTLAFYLWSVELLDPTLAAVLIYFSPLLVAWFSNRYFGERLGALAIPTAVLTLIGVVVANLDRSLEASFQSSGLQGILFGLVGVAGWTFYTLFLRHLSARYGNDELTLTSFASSMIFFLAGTLAFGEIGFEPAPETLGTLAAYVLLSSVSSFFLYSVAVREAGAGPVSLLLGIELLSTAIFSFAFGTETFGPWKLAGLVIVVAVVTMFLWSQWRLHAAVREPLPA